MYASSNKIFGRWHAAFSSCYVAIILYCIMMSFIRWLTSCLSTRHVSSQHITLCNSHWIPYLAFWIQIEVWWSIEVNQDLLWMADVINAEVCDVFFLKERVVDACRDQATHFIMAACYERGQQPLLKCWIGFLASTVWFEYVFCNAMDFFEGHILALLSNIGCQHASCNAFICSQNLEWAFSLQYVLFAFNIWCEHAVQDGTWFTLWRKLHRATRV